MPGYHHGGFSDDQYAWLATELATPAEHGTILVIHHAPITYRSPVMQLLDFDDVDRLRAVVEGTDVRAVLSGHLHVTSFGTLGAVPVFVAGGVSYVDDVGAPRELLMGVDGPQSWNLIEVHDDQVVGTVVPVEAHPTWPALSEAVMEFMATVPETGSARGLLAQTHVTQNPSKIEVSRRAVADRRRGEGPTGGPNNNEESDMSQVEKATSADGTTIAYEAYGSGPVAVVVGGAFCDRGAFRDVAQALGGLGLTGCDVRPSGPRRQR